MSRSGAWRMELWKEKYKIIENNATTTQHKQQFGTFNFIVKKGKKLTKSTTHTQSRHKSIRREKAKKCTKGKPFRMRTSDSETKTADLYCLHKQAITKRPSIGLATFDSYLTQPNESKRTRKTNWVTGETDWEAIKQLITDVPAWLWWCQTGLRCYECNPKFAS